MTTTVIRTVCAHDCPDMCSILAHVEDGRLVRVEGDPDQPFTAGFVCGKVRREPELVHSPDRVRTPLRRTGPKGAGEFRPVSWDEALDELAERWQAIRREDGPLGILGYCYSAHQGQFNRWVPMALFHALGTTRLQPGTICDTCADVAWEMTCGPVGGADPEAMVHSDLIVSWSADLVTTAVHAWAKTEEARARGAQLVVIDPRRSRTAAQADWHVAPRIGTDAALALGLMHVLVRDGLADRDYLARQTVGFDRLEREVLPRFAPDRVATITGLPRADVERLAHLYGRARAPYIRIGFGMSRSSQGGQGVRAVACLPAVVGAYGKPGGGALLATVGGFGFSFEAVRRPSGPAATRLVNHSRLGQALLELRDPPIRALFVSANNPAVTCPDAAARPPGAHARGPLHGRSRPVPHRHRSLRRSGAAGDDVPRDRGPLPGVRGLLRAVRPAGGAGSGRGVVQREARSGAGPPARRRRRGVLDDHARNWSARPSSARRGPPRASIPTRSGPPAPSRSTPIRTGSDSGRRRASSSSTRRPSRPRGCHPCPTGTRTPRRRRWAAGGRFACSPRPGTFRATRRSRVTTPSGVARACRS